MAQTGDRAQNIDQFTLENECERSVWKLNMEVRDSSTKVGEGGQTSGSGSTFI